MTDQQQLLRVVRSVRWRWRLKAVLRGIAFLALSATAVLLAGGYAIDVSRFDAAAVTAARGIAWLAFAAALLRLVAWPLLRRLSDERVALYLEEHEPDLEGRVLAAVELGHQRPHSTSPVLVQRLLRSAVQQCRKVDDGKRIERTGLWQSSGLVAGSTVFGLGLFLLGPAYLYRTAPTLLVPWQEPGVHNPYRIDVVPGDATLARGSDLEVAATLVSFDAADAELVVGGKGEERRWSMLRQPDGEAAGSFRLMLFDLDGSTEYFVEASGVRSETFQIEVVELPYVEDIHLTYHFPSYTGLDPVEQPGSGDIAALVGTEVRLTVTPTIAVAGGAIEVEGGETLPLTAGEDGRLNGSITVRRAGNSGSPPSVHPGGRYRVLLDGHVASPDYRIDPIADQPPILTLVRPGRDLQVTSLEEVTAEVRAQDDYGVHRVELVSSVNGGEERSHLLYRGGDRRTGDRRIGDPRTGRKDFLGTETLFLEEYELQPGDLISYYARAGDGYAGDPPHETVSDIYFLEIRPFDRNYRQADQGGMSGPQGMGGGELSERQRMIIAATFKLARGAAASPTLRDDVATVALSQGRLRQEVAGLAEQLTARGTLPGSDSPVRRTAVAAMVELLPLAAEEMGVAEEALGRGRPAAALSPEQKALQLLQRAEAAFRDIQVSRGQQGGGGGQGEMSDELADLFELELDKLRNQYEEVERGEQGRLDDQIDETLERLRQLARRQQQENERLRARARQGQGGARAGRVHAGTSGDSQRRLADEAEEVARQLERLARRQSAPELAETARRLRRAAEEMRRAAAAGDRTGEALGSSALGELRQARRQLERGRSGRLERDTRQALERTRRLRRQQQGMVERVERLDTDDPGEDDLRRILEAKGRMGAEVGHLETDLDQLAREARRDQPEASRRLEEAADGLRDEKLRDKILYSRGVVQQGSRAYARNFEENIEEALSELEKRLRSAAGAIGESRGARLERALEDTREAVTGLESLTERLRAGGDGRQLGRELAARRAELEELRGRLGGEGIDTSELDRIVAGLRRMSSAIRASGAPGSAVLAELEGDVVRGLKEFEYSLRRSLVRPDDADRRPLAVSDGEVPDGYQEMVEEYYKALAAAKQ